MFSAGNSKKIEDVVNLQYSCENGVVGFDWVLIAKRNIADKNNIMKFAHELGYAISEREENDCKYLRAEGQKIADLGFKIITDFYKISSGTKLDLVIEGFEWNSSVINN